MRRLALACSIATMVGCGTAKEQPASAAADAAPAGAAGISLAEVAGTWNMRTMNEKGDMLVTYQMAAAADPSDWTITFPDRQPVPVRIIAVAGDSIVTETGPYESALRKGVQVTVNGVFRLQDGKLMGTAIAHYATRGPDSTLNLRSEGTRAP